MKNILSLLVLALAAPLAAGAQNTTSAPSATKPATINVRLDKPFKGKAYLTCVIGRYTRVDSAAVDGTQFTLHAPARTTDLYRVSSRPWGIDADVIVEPGCTYNVSTARRSRIFSISTADGKEQKLLNALNAELLPLAARTDSLAMIMSDLGKNGRKAEAEQMQEQQLRPLWDKQEQLKVDFALANPRTFAALVAADGVLSSDYKTLRPLYLAMDTVSFRNTYSWQSFKKKYDEVATKWIQDRPAPEFTTTDINGKKVSLKDFRGKYVLLDFWASWCAPCRKKMKELKAVYPELVKKGITVLSVSGDHNRAAWLKASKEDGVVWTNTCEVAPFKDNKILQAYHVTNVPTLFVIDPDGKIIDQNPGIEEIMKLRIKF